MKKSKLIFIYGPPASGKLTYAKKLSEITSVSLFHNHLSFDLAASIYTVWSKKFYKYCEKLRINSIKRKIKAKESLIFTFCYSHGEDDRFVKKVIDTVENNGGEIIFVKLKASKKDILERVENEDRKKYQKINNKKELKKYIKKHKLFKSIKHKNNIIIKKSNYKQNLEFLKKILS